MNFIHDNIFHLQWKKSLVEQNFHTLINKILSYFFPYYKDVFFWNKIHIKTGKNKRLYLYNEKRQCQHQYLFLKRVFYFFINVFGILNKFLRFFCVRPMKKLLEKIIFCEFYRKGARKRKLWEASFWFSLSKSAGSAKSLHCKSQKKQI